MKTLSIEGSVRTEFGKKGSKLLRREGQVPCVIYGGKETIHFATDERTFNKINYTPDVFNIKVNLAGKEYSTVLQASQFHPVSDKIIHADFIELFEDKEVTLKLPVFIKGIPIGVRNGGKLQLSLKQLSITALPSALPDAIEINIEGLRIGQAIRISDVAELKDLNVNHSENAVIVSVKTSRVAIVDEDEDEEEATGEEATEGGDDQAESGE